jgi:DNA-binding XRE family transcriptional regulator
VLGAVAAWLLNRPGRARNARPKGAIVVEATTSLVRRIGLAAREARHERGWSERELARLANVSRQTLHRLEGGRNVRPDLAAKVALAVLVVDVYSAPPERRHSGQLALAPLPDELFEGSWAS